MEQFEITEKHKQIYNTYLKHLAQKNNRLYKRRKDFSKLEPQIVANLLKLELFFNRNPEIDMDLYFKAGFQYASDTFLDLGYFLNLIVLRNYSKVIKERYNIFVDSDESFKDFIRGFEFIVSFVKANNIQFNDYVNCRNERGVLWCLIHLKQQRISLYHLHAFNFSISGLADEILNIYLEDFRTKFFETKRQYTFSNRLKTVGDKVLNKNK